MGLVMPVCAVTAADVFSAAPSTIADGEQGVLLLQDGGTIAGRISQVANSYIVARGGSEIQIAPARVFFIGRSMHDLYEYRSTHLSNDSIDAHLALAEWCLRYNLMSEADAELAIARKLQSDHPKLLLLERRFAAANRPAPLSSAPATSTPAVSPPGSTKPQPAAPLMPDLPDGVLENFTRKVQPILVNNCTAAKCHEPGGPQQFQLSRAILRGEANRRTTMQNLAATLALVDREHPERSQLLTLPRQTHAGMDTPIVGYRQQQAFKHLADWVTLIAPPEPIQEDHQQSDPATASIAATSAPSHAARSATSPPAELMVPPALPIAKASELKDASNPAVQDAGSTNLDPAVQPASATGELSPPSLRGPQRLKFGASAVQWRPRDPFDPEIFNRRQRATATPRTPLKP